jgi:hypothetical protein
MNQPKTIAELEKLTDNEGKWLDMEMPKVFKPVPPVCGIDQNILAIKTNIGSIRNLFLIPWFLGLFVVLFLWTDDFYSAWQANERSTIHFVEHQKIIHGEDYFETIADPVALSMYRRLNKEGKFELGRYIKYRYMDTPGGNRRLKVDIGFGIFWIVTFTTLSTCIVRFRQFAPLYIDRKRSIAYTWRKGDVWAQRYDQLSFYKYSFGLYVYLRSEHKSGELYASRFCIQPSGNPYYNPAGLCELALAAIVQFVNSGRDAVWQEDWQGSLGYYFRKDKKPDDFDERVKRILARIDAEIAEQARQQPVVGAERDPASAKE